MSVEVSLLLATWALLTTMFVPRRFILCAPVLLGSGNLILAAVVYVVCCYVGGTIVPPEGQSMGRWIQIERSAISQVCLLTVLQMLILLIWSVVSAATPAIIRFRLWTVCGATVILLLLVAASESRVFDHTRMISLPWQPPASVAPDPSDPELQRTDTDYEHSSDGSIQ